MNEFFLAHAAISWSFFTLFALIIGSFLNVVIYRLPRMLHASWTIQCHDLLHQPQEPATEINLCYPRSMCPHCKQSIPAWHNIPLFSYFLLRGRCHACQKSISCRYPLVEILCLILSCYALYTWGFTLHLLSALAFIYLCLCMIFIDLEHHIIPDVCSLGLLWLGLLANTQALFTSCHDAIGAAVIGYLSLWILIKIYAMITGKIGMGHGDFKLFAAFGAWFGLESLPWILLISSSLGAITGLIYLKYTQQGRHTPIPFGPFLCMGGMVALIHPLWSIMM